MCVFGCLCAFQFQFQFCSFTVCATFAVDCIRACADFASRYTQSRNENKSHDDNDDGDVHVCVCMCVYMDVDDDGDAVDRNDDTTLQNSQLSCLPICFSAALSLSLSASQSASCA